MTTTNIDGTVREYSNKEVMDILHQEGVSVSDGTYLTAIMNHAIVCDESIVWIKPVEMIVFEVDTAQTGTYTPTFGPKILLLNTKDFILTYDTISDLHTAGSADVYLWLINSYVEEDEPLEVMGEWYRKDYYPDGMKEFDGKTLGWEDLAPKIKE